MDVPGFIHNKTEVKVLILYILSKLPRPVEVNTLAELVLCDAGINYFDYADALNELCESAHVTAKADKYSITEKGTLNVSETISSLPFTVRLNASRQAERLSRILERSAMVETGVFDKEDGSCVVSLSLSDTLGNIMRLDILAGNREQAGEMERKFKKNAEELYISIADMLLE